tara:strand:- start:147 stop:458 length:312 start_codon:yes stop_codon:yes gene_type:complete
MRLSDKMMEIFSNWDKEAFRAAHHADYMFVRELEMVTLDEHVEIMDGLKQQGYDVEKRVQVIHEDDHVGIIRYDEGEETVSNVSLVKDGLLWRGFVNRTPKKG